MPVKLPKKITRNSLCSIKHLDGSIDKIHMQDGHFLDGKLQSFYFPEGHWKAGLFKGMHQIIQEHISWSQFARSHKFAHEFKCLPGGGNMLLPPDSFQCA